MTAERDPWEGCPPGWQRVMVFCKRGEGAGHHRKFLGRGWAHRFGDGFPAVAFDPGAQHIRRTGVTHADGGVTFGFSCPFRGCTHQPEVREDRLGEQLAAQVARGDVDGQGRVVLNAGTLP